MFSTKLNSCCRLILPNVRSIYTNIQCLNKKREHPFKRTIRILSEDFTKLTKPNSEAAIALNNVFPHHVDIVIIGGGAIGTSIAYFLKDKSGLNGLNIAVIEKDETYAKCSTVLSVGGLRQQFSLPENIQMSLYGAEFLRGLKDRFGEDADVYFTPHGYLMLASPEGAEQLTINSKLQNELGAHNILLGKEALKERFPWMNVHDVELGCLGLEKEGWFDPWSLLNIMKRGAIKLNTQYISGEAVGFTFRNRQDMISEGIVQGSYEGLDELMVKLPNGEIKSIKFAICILAAGAESGKVAELANIGIGEGILQVPLPVERRKRFVYCFDCKGDAPTLNTPMTIDYTGAYFRRDGLGGSFLAGLSPTLDEEPDTSNLDVDHEYFDNKIWPVIANRVPAFENIKVRSSWGGYYDFNTFDENGIIGPHSYYHNLYIATGFSGHGIQQAPAVGRAVAEHIIDGDYKSIDLTRLSYDRLLVDKRMYEVCIV